MKKKRRRTQFRFIHSFIHSKLKLKMNSLITPLWPSLLPPVCDQLWFTPDFPKNEEAELAALEEELEQEKLLLKEQSKWEFY
jgi:hypothetical protein